MKQLRRTIYVTHAQATTLDKMPLHRVLEQLKSGAVVISFELLEAAWMVVDLDGKIHSFNHFLSGVSKRV
jgi:hypothetical protein